MSSPAKGGRGFSRRRLLAAALAGATGAALATQSRPLWAAEAAPSLDSLARAKGMRFGTALSARGINNARLAALITAECGLIVPENELKMPSVQPTPGEFRFDRADSMVEFAAGHGIGVRGHCLLWHHPRWVPGWFDTYDFGAQPASAAAQLLTRHVHTTARHFAGRIPSWDVVNEAVDNVTGAMRETALSRAAGSPHAVVDLAFRATREVLPDTELVYNDYMGWEPDSAAHRDGVLRLLEHFRRTGVPVDALGIQAHLGSGNQENNAHRAFDARDERAWRRFLDEVTGMGYRLLITEFDVHDANAAGDIAARDAQVAALGRAFLDITLSYPQVNALLCWGLVDSMSWLQGRTPRSDGAPKRPTPFDSNFEPKPLRAAMAAAIAAAPMRSS